jgi:Uncharacterized protein conserved in archaea
MLDLRLEYCDEKIAKAVFDAISPDNEGYVETKLDKNTITLHVSSETAGSLKNTADDLLACIKIAEDSSGLISGPASDLDRDSLFE